jgi:preprotein translocase subunit SecE
MAVAEDERVERAERVERPAKGSGADGEGPGGALGYIPRKLRELRAFLTEVRAELKKVTWPSRQEVSATTVVVMATTVFFGFYLWGLDLVFSRILSQVLKR